MKERDYNLIKKLIKDTKAGKLQWNGNIVKFREFEVALAIYNTNVYDGNKNHSFEVNEPTGQRFELWIQKLYKNYECNNDYIIGNTLYSIDSEVKPLDYNTMEADFSEDEVSVEYLYKLVRDIKNKNDENEANKAIENLMTI